MDAMERDPAHIAKQIKFVRKVFRLTQENLAAESGLTTRTIEKLESGRYRPEEQTLRSLARALKIDIKYFEKPGPEEEAKTRAEMERAIRKIVAVPTRPIRSANDILNAIAQVRGFRFDTSQVDKDAALDITATIIDWIRDLIDGWNDLSMSDQVKSAREIAALCEQIEQHGFVCYFGHHGQQLKQDGRTPLAIEMGVLSIQKNAGTPGERYAIVDLEGRWETLNQDRFPIPEGEK